MLYEIADDVHWLMLTDVKHIKKSVLCAQGLYAPNATYEQTADLSLYTWYCCMTSTYLCHSCDLGAVNLVNNSISILFTHSSCSILSAWQYSLNLFDEKAVPLSEIMRRCRR